jgi:phage virion morphogenesis protein
MITFKVDTSQLENKFRQFSQGLDYTDVMQKIGENVVEETNMQFDQQGGRFLPKWADIKESTKKQRVRKGFGTRPILVNTGDLKKSFRVKQADSKSVIVGTDIDYATYHQTGTSKMPKREMMKLTDKMKLAYNTMVANFIIEKLRG